MVGINKEFFENIQQIAAKKYLSNIIQSTIHIDLVGLSMTSLKSRYQEPMQPWPALASYSERIKLSTTDLELFYFEGGSHDRPMLLMVHGLGDEADTWRHVFSPLSKQFHTIAVDLPGFGRTEKPKTDYTPQFFINTIIDLLDQLGINQTILIGSSLGGILAQGLALTHPEHVKGLVLVGGAAFHPAPMQDLSLRLMLVPILGEWLYTRLRKNPDAAFASLKNVYYDLEALPQEDQAFLYKRVNQRVWSDGQRRAYFSTLRNLVPYLKRLQAGLAEQLQKLEIPTLVIRGENDVLFPDSIADAIIEMQLHANKATICKAGHLPHQESPVDFLQKVLPWLEKLL